AQCGVEYEREPRYAGTTTYTFGKMLRLALDGVTGFSDRPLRIVTRIGLVATVIGLGFGIYVLTAQAIGDAKTLRGWPSLMTAVLFMGGIQLLCVGILGEYVGRIYRETKHRPLYVVGERVNFGADQPVPPVDD